MMIKENDVKKMQNFWLDAQKKFHAYSTSIRVYLQILLLFLEIFIESLNLIDQCSILFATYLSSSVVFNNAQRQFSDDD